MQEISFRNDILPLKDKLFRLALRITLDRAEAEDVVHSCFIDTVLDSLEGIYRSLDNFAMVSKFGGGMGMYFGKVRAAGGNIRGFKGGQRALLTHLPRPRPYREYEPGSPLSPCPPILATTTVAERKSHAPPR